MNYFKNSSLRSDPWLLHRQLESLTGNVLPSSVANLVNGAICAVLFEALFPRWALLLGYLLLVLLIIWRYSMALELKQLVAKGNKLRRLSMKVNVNAALLGMLWGSANALLMPIAPPSEQVFLAVIGAGMISAGAITFRARKPAALLYVGFSIPGGFLSLHSLGGIVGTASVCLLFCYAIVLAANIASAASEMEERYAHERDLAQSSETIHMLLNDYTEQGSDWLVETNTDGKIINPCARFAEAIRRPIETLDQADLFTLFESSPERAQLEEHFQAKRPFRHLILSLISHGEQLWWSVSARPVVDREGIRYRGVITDVTAQRHAEARVSHLATHDGLTDLPNRIYFNERFEHALARDGGAGLMYLDLDHFKLVNDTLGHPIGDKLLKAVARRLQTVAHPDDMVARLGGDEFAIMVPVARIDRMDALAMDVVRAIGDGTLLGEHDAHVGVSIGMVAAPDQKHGIESLFRNADLALYAAKAKGRNCALWFTPAMDDAAHERRRIELELQAALETDQLCLHYQPIVDVKSGRTTGYEALLRWQHPERGMVMPDAFISVAEETGLILQIGEWVIRRAVADLATWPDQCNVSINLSPAQMRSPTLVTTVVTTLAKTQVDARRICMEITESVLMQDSDANIATLHKLRDLGIQIALDDFGTGFSSLNYLRCFPFSKIKIDRCFVNDIDQSAESRAIVRSIVGLAHALGMTTVAEGVERADQVDHLRTEGCTEMQGFLFSRAVPSDQLGDLHGRRTTGGNRIALEAHTAHMEDTARSKAAKSH
jgi:diguanylate cyclase (GGDEF)-like protein